METLNIVAAGSSLSTDVGQALFSRQSRTTTVPPRTPPHLLEWYSQRISTFT
jgi:hypothetical protein